MATQSDMNPTDTAVAQHYQRPDLLGSILAGLRATGKDPDAPTPDDLAPVDHFHQGGVDASLELARLARFAPSMRVLDVGGGFGGPARLLAARIGCRCTVVDLNDAYCALGTELTRRTGLSSRVHFEHASALAMPFAAASFDAAWTQHSSMNIDDKVALYREVHRVLRPGARLAIHEVMAGARAPIHFPVPWARTPSISFLRRPDEVRAAIVAQGFREVGWYDVTARTLDWLRQRVAAARAAPAPPPLGIHLLLGEDAPTMFGNLLRNVEEGRQEVVQAVFERV